jgi:PKD domain
VTSRLPLGLALLCLGSGCVRHLQVLKLDGPLEAGVAGTFSGTPKALRWDFGDGTPPSTSLRGTHAWAKAGTYTVQAWDDDFLTLRAEVTVVPRALLRAVPPQATSVLYAPTLGQPLSEAVDFLERALGAAQLQKWLDETLVPALAVESASGGGVGLDPAEGVGVFGLEGVEGRVALVGVDDDEKALAALISRLQERGADVAERTLDGITVATLPDSTPVVAFVDRGYLYAVWPTSPLDAARAVGLVRSAESGSERFGAEAADGQLAFRFTPGAGESDWNWAHGGLRVAGDAATLTGRVAGKKPLWSGKAQVPLVTLAQGGPIFVASLGVSPDVLASLALGAKGGERRARLAAALKEEGVELEKGLSGFTGELGALVYFDAEAFLKNLVVGTQKPEPRGALVIEAGVKDAASVGGVLRRLVAWLAPGAIEAGSAPNLTWQGKWLDAAMMLALTAKTARLTGGTSQTRPQVELASSLAGRFGGAFSPGHVSLLLDVGQLRRELQAPRLIPGLDPARVVTVQGFAAAFLDQLTPLDTVVLDMWPDAQGAVLAGKVTLKPRQ